MANWIENELEVTGPSSDLEAFLSAADSNINGKEVHISFAALLPIPEGEPDPSRWAWDNWGTRADVWEWIGLERLPESFIACFATAWSAPTTLFQTVSRRYPTLTFQLQYQDKDGGFFGNATIKSGEMQLVESEYDSEDDPSTHNDNPSEPPSASPV